MVNKNSKKRIKQVKIILITLLTLLIARLVVIINDTKIISASASNYNESEIIRNENYKLLDVNYEEIIDCETKFVWSIKNKKITKKIKNHKIFGSKKAETKMAPVRVGFG